MNIISTHFSFPAGITGSCHIIFYYFFMGQNLVDFCPSGSGWQCFVPVWTWRVVPLSCNQLFVISLGSSTQMFHPYPASVMQYL